MFKKLLLMITLGIIGLLMMTIPKSFEIEIGVISNIGVFIIMIYLLSLGVLIYLDSKNINKTLVYQIIPILIGGIVFFFLFNIIKINIIVPSTFELFLLFLLSSITYLSPILCYLLYSKIKYMNLKKQLKS